MIRLLLRCYPARWRKRYGAEFAELLAARSLAPFDVADVLLGALDAHLHFRGTSAALDQRMGFGMSPRIGGYAAIWAGILWIFALMGYSAVFIIGAALAFVVALVALSASHGRTGPLRIWAPVAVGVPGGASAVIGALALALNGWSSSWSQGYPFVLLFVGVGAVYAASGMFAVSALRERTFSRRSSQLLLIGSSVGLSTMVLYVLAFASALPPLGLEGVVGLVGPASLLVFAAGWIGVGLDTLLRDLVSSSQLHPGKPAA